MDIDPSVPPVRFETTTLNVPVIEERKRLDRVSTAVVFAVIIIIIIITTIKGNSSNNSNKGKVKLSL
jgi:integral membrane sensor domain MASE1